MQEQDLKNSKKNTHAVIDEKATFNFFFSSTGEEKGHKSFKLIPPVRMNLWILDQKPTGPNRVGKSLPVMFSIVRTAGASPAELTNE